MSIRKRDWVTPNDKPRSAYVVDYFDANGVRRNKQFRTKREAADWAAETRVDLKQGTHVAERDSPTVAEAGKLWLETCEADELEASTLELYQGYLNNHIGPLIGDKRLVEMTVPALATFRAQMLARFSHAI